LLNKAAEFYHSDSLSDKTDFNRFLDENSYWIEGYSLFTALKEYFNGVSFLDFEKEIKLRNENAVNEYKIKLGKEIEIAKIIQFFFFVQWKKLKEYANRNGIEIVGDIPIYVAGDSADVWEHSELFELNQDRLPTKIAGVPPDIFSETGQLWGNPIYNWEKLKESNYQWWMERLKMNFKLFDIVRIDHFRGFAEYWSIPGGDKTAEFGEWVAGPGYEFFDFMFRKLGKVNIIAEDLGLITPSVGELLKKCNFPGMKIMQFAFDSGEQNDFLPHRYPRNCVVYTGTHDNDTVNGWYQKLNEKGKNFMEKYFSLLNGNAGQILTKYTWATVADIVIAPVQDILNLDSEARMNFPGKAENNWKWRLKTNELKPEHAEFLKEITILYEREPKSEDIKI
jgi:4-alpha-glucanotransferase